MLSKLFYCVTASTVPYCATLRSLIVGFNVCEHYCNAQVTQIMVKQNFKFYILTLVNVGSRGSRINETNSTVKNFKPISILSACVYNKVEPTLLELTYLFL